MSKLLIRPSGDQGQVLGVTPETAQWSYVGFDLHRLARGERASGCFAAEEAILVLVEGKGHLHGEDVDFGEVGERLSVFERSKPYCLYVPAGTRWSIQATTELTLAVCKAPGRGDHPMCLLKPDDIASETRGKGANTRHIHPIAMEDRDIADSLLVTEVFTPQGNWSSYPPHRHDEDDYPNMTYLEETYYHRLNPEQGFGFQRVFTEDGTLDETMTVRNHDLVLVPRGHHPCGAPYGYEMYYLNVMAGPLRKWRFQNHPDHHWIFERDRQT